jgi:hypothetical protein
MLSIPLAWLIARDLAGDFAAAGAAVLVAASPQHIAVSQYARAYALLILLLMGAFYCLQRTRLASALLTACPKTTHSRTVWWWSGYATCAVAALYTHHTAVVIIAALNLSVLRGSTGTNDVGRRFLKAWLATNVLIAASYLPWLPVLFVQMFPQSHVLPAAQTLPPADVSSALAVHAPLFLRLWTMISNPVPFAGLPWIDVRMLPVILFAAWRLRRSREMAVLTAFVLSGLALMLAASLFRPLIDSKTLAWAGLFALAGVAAGCSAAGCFRLPLLMFVVLIELGSVPAALEPVPEGWRDVAAILRDEALPQDTVYTNYAAAVLPLRHYGWSESGVIMKVFAKSNDEPWFRGHSWATIAPQAVAGDALRQENGRRRIWVLGYGTKPPDGITNEIAAVSVRALHRRTEKLDLSLFLPR